MIKYLPLVLLLTGCLEVEPINVNANEPDLPCLDGWQYDFLGQPIVDPYGAQLRCE